VSVSVDGARLRFLESGAFRQLPPPEDLDDGFVFLGSVIVMADQPWRIVGSAPNPHRSDETLVVVELAPDRRIGTEPRPDRRRASDVGGP
jgi:hypothetical protein